MRPDNGVSWPATMLNRVVFPAPFGPISARRSPGSMLNDTSRTAFSPPNWIETCSATSGPMRPDRGLRLYSLDANHLARLLRRQREASRGASSADPCQHLAHDAARREQHHQDVDHAQNERPALTDIEWADRHVLAADDVAQEDQHERA